MRTALSKGPRSSANAVAEADNDVAEADTLPKHAPRPQVHQFDVLA